MSVKTLLNGLHKLTSDEFYTRRADVQEMLAWVETCGAHIPRHVYMPCDTLQSAFVQELFNRGYTVDATSDDFRRHDFTGKFIVTNPPFSLFNRVFYEKLRREAAGFMVVCPLTALFSPHVFADLADGRCHSFNTHVSSWEFLRPDGSTSNAPAAWLTTLDIPPCYRVQGEPPDYGSLPYHACTFRGIRLKEVARLPVPVNVPDGALLACTVSVLCEIPDGYTLVSQRRPARGFTRAVLCKGVKAENMLF